MPPGHGCSLLRLLLRWRQRGGRRLHQADALDQAPKTAASKPGPCVLW